MTYPVILAILMRRQITATLDLWLRPRKASSGGLNRHRERMDPVEVAYRGPLAIGRTTTRLRTDSKPPAPTESLRAEADAILIGTATCAPTTPTWPSPPTSTPPARP